MKQPLHHLPAAIFKRVEYADYCLTCAKYAGRALNEPLNAIDQVGVFVQAFFDKPLLLPHVSHRIIRTIRVGTHGSKFP
jgi:hypothetical protein